MLKNSMSSSLQENVLTVLCFHDEAAKIIRGYVEVEFFESRIYQEIASAAIDFLDTYKTTVKEHLSDTLIHLIEKADERKKNLYEDTLLNLYSYRDSVNVDYTLSQINKFVRQQKLKQTLSSAVESVQSDNLDEAEFILSKHLKSSIELFDIGLDFKSIGSRIHKIFGDEVSGFEIGIEPFDQLGIFLSRKELFTILALPNKGKSWMMMHIAKFCALQRLKVLYISLEMSQDKLAGRLLQSLYSIGSREANHTITSMKKDSLGRFLDLDFKKITRPSVKDENLIKLLLSKLETSGSRLKIIIKQFPTSTLTIRGLESYLDALENQARFVPDVILVDYADLMKINTSQIRVETGQIYKDLRGLAVERNLAMVTASQCNRAGNKEKWITMEGFAEDFSKAGISDIVISYNQSDAEYQLGLARLLACKVRDSVKDIAVLITQSYGLGQFCLDSVKMEENYWNQLKAHTKNASEEDS